MRKNKHKLFGNTSNDNCIGGIVLSNKILNNMKIKDLIKELKGFDPESTVGFYMNPTRDQKELSCFDIPLEASIMGNEYCPDILFTLDKTGFETITDLLEETKKEINIKMNNKGIYVYSDNKLIREIERSNRYNKEEMNTAPEEYIKMLIHIL